MIHLCSFGKSIYNNYISIFIGFEFKWEVGNLVKAMWVVSLLLLGFEF